MQDSSAADNLEVLKRADDSYENINEKQSGEINCSCQFVVQLCEEVTT